MTLRCEVLFGVQHQDAVLVDDSDHHDGAHEGRDVQRRPGQEQGQQGARTAKDRRDQDGDRVREGAELEHKYDEDQKNRHQENLRQTQERLALDLVEAAELDASARGKRDFLEQPPLDFLHGRTQVPALEPRRHDRMISKVLAVDLGLLRLDFQVRHAGERDGVPGWRGDQQAPQLVRRIPVLERVAHADADEPIAPYHVGRELPVEDRRFELGNIPDAEPCALRLVQVHAEIGSGSDHDRAVDDVHYALDFGQPFFDFPGHLLMDPVVVLVDLDLDRLRRPGQVSHKILEDVGKLDLDGGLGIRDLATEFGDHLFKGAFPLAFELYEKVPRVRLCDGESQPGAGPAGIALDLRGLAQESLDMAQDTVGLLQRRTRRHDVIKDKGPFVHVREKAGAELIVKKDRDSQDPAGCGEDEAGVLERPTKRRFVARRQPAEQRALAGLLGPLEVGPSRAGRGLQNEPGQNRSEKDCQEQRGEQGRNQRHGQGAKEYGRDSAEKDQGHENYNGCESRSDKRRRELVDSAPGRLGGGLPHGKVDGDILDHDDRIVDHDAD